jgi:hypothetical protein
MAITVDGAELNVSWSEDQAVSPIAAEAAQDKPDFAAMKKAELVEYLAPNGDKLDTTLTKAELVKLAEQLFATQG